MRFPTVVFLLVCGSMLLIGGTLIGSGPTASIGVICLAVAAALILWAVWRFVTDSLHDRRLRKLLHKPISTRGYRPGAGLR